MKKFHVVLILLFSGRVFAATITPPHLPATLPKTIDALDFFVPTGSAVGWVIGGHQTQPLPSPWGTKDPEGTKFKTYAMVKFNNPLYYEVYKADQQNIYIRYEQCRHGFAALITRGIRKEKFLLPGEYQQPDRRLSGVI